MRPAARRLAATLAALVVLTLAAGCGSKDEPDAAATATAPTTSAATASPSQSATPEGTTIAVTFADGDVEPKAQRVDVGVGEPVTLEISADEAGELHVHSSPEQSVEYAAGDSVHTLSFERPGVIEIESHHPATLVVQLQVR